MADAKEDALAMHIDAEAEINNSSDPPKSYTYYHAGPLFNISDLQNNVRLSTKIREVSQGKYQAILPQDLENRETTPHSIRDDDIKALLACDLALFTYDGSELDSGTVVEYLVAKFADIPSVILRTDFRGGGDQGSHKGDPWNLMSSFWPRTVGVVVNAMTEYKIGLGKSAQSTSGITAEDLPAVSQAAGNRLLDVTAAKVFDAFEEVVQMPPRLPKELRQHVYHWLGLVPGFKFDGDEANMKHMLQLMQNKTEKGLL